MAETILEDTGKITRTGFSDIELTLSLVSTDAGDFRLVLDPRMTGGAEAIFDADVIDIPFESAVIDVPSADIVSSVAQYQSADLPDSFPAITSAATTAVSGFSIPVGETWRNVDIEDGDEQTKNLGVSKPTIPVFTVSGSVPDGVSLPFDIESLPTTVEEATGLVSIGVPDVETRYWEFQSAIPFTSEAEFSFGSISVDELFEVEEIVIDLDNIPLPDPEAIIELLEPVDIDTPTDALETTFTMVLENTGDADSTVDVALDIKPSWKSTGTSANESYPIAAGGGEADIDIPIDDSLSNFGDMSRIELIQAITNSGGDTLENTDVTVEHEITGDGVPSDAGWPSGSKTVDFTDALPEIPDEESDLGPPELSIDSLLSEFIIDGPQNATDAIDVTVEHDGPATPAEDITVSGFGDSVTIDRLERGETDEVLLTPDVAGLSPENPIQDQVVVEFDGTEQDSQPVTIEQPLPDVADLDLQPISDITLSPDEGLPSSISVGVLNRGDAEGTGTVETPFGSTEVTVPPGEGATAPTERAAIGLSGIEPPEPGDDADSYTVSLLNADGQQVATESFNIRKQIEADFDKPGLPFDAEALPLQVDSDTGYFGGSAYKLRLYIHDFSVPDGTVAMSFDWEQQNSGAIAGGSIYAWVVNSEISQDAIDILGQDGSSGTGSNGKITRTFDNLSVGDTVHAAVEWEYGTKFGFAQVSWDVKPIPGVTSQRGLTIADATIPDELRPGSVTPFDVSVGHSYGGALVSGDVVFYINDEEFERITVDDVFPNDPTSFTPRPPSPNSGVLSGIEPPAIITAKVETQTPSGRVVDSVPSEKVEIREPVPIDASLSPSLPNSLPATGEVELPVSVSNNASAPLSTVVSVSELDVSQTVNVPASSTETFNLGPVSVSDLTSLSELTFTSEASGIADVTASRPSIPKPNIGFSVAEPDLLDVGESLTLPVDVTNSGGKDGEVDVSLTPDGGDTQTQTVTVPAGGSETVDFTPTPPSPDNPLTYTVNVAGEEQTVTARMEEVEPADFSLETPDSVTMDEPSVVEVEAVVENTGQEAGSTEVSMLDASEVVELDGGESTPVPLRTDITPSPGDVQEYTVELSDGTSDTVGVEFPTDISDTSRPTAEIDVQNTGDVAGSMTLLLGGNIVGSREVDAGETATFTVEPPLPDPGTESLYEVRVRPDDDNDSGDTEQFNMATDVLPTPEPPSFNLVDVVAPDEARVGQSITVDAIVENTGGESGEVTVRSDGDIRQVTIDGGSQEIVTLSLPSPFNQGFEDYEVSVGDQSERVNVDFREVEPDVPDAPELPETPEQPVTPQPPSRGPGIPARPGDGDKPYDGIFTYLDPLGVLGTSEQISLDLFGDD